MEGTLYGYIRVSSREQNIDRQWDALLRHGIKNKNIFVDKQSGKSFNRPQYKRLMTKLKAGDCLVITSIDRLGRNYTEIQEQWRIIAQEHQTDIVVLDMPLLNTRNGHDDLTGKFLSDMVLQILSYVAETERTNIRKRQVEGIVAAQARGVCFGRQTKPLPENYFEIMDMWKQGRLTSAEAASRMHVSRSWVYRHARRDYEDV